MAKINEALNKYLQLCAKFAPIDINVAHREILAAIKHHDKIKFDPADMKKMLALHAIWYNSLDVDSKNPDYSVYSDPYYFCETWLCWIKYSKRYLKEIQLSRSMSDKSIVDYMNNVSSVLDLGCGAGYTTAELKKIFPKAKVYGTNFEGSSQFQIAKYLGKKHGFKIFGNHSGIKADLIFASEYFEHIQAPVEHLMEILKDCDPEYLLVANTFNSRAIGHFNEYLHFGNKLSGKETSRLFNATLNNIGYKKVITQCWNNRPAFWQKSHAGRLSI